MILKTLISEASITNTLEMKMKRLGTYKMSAQIKISNNLLLDSFIVLRSK